MPGESFFVFYFGQNVLFDHADGAERISCSWKEPNVFYQCRWNLQLFARGKALHRVSRVHATLFMAAGEKPRSSRVAGLPASARRRSFRRSRAQSRRHRVRSILRGQECAPRCRVRGCMPCFSMRLSWFAPCVLLPSHHRRCCCSVLAAPSETTVVVCWLRRARRPSTWHVRATQSAAWSWANPKHDALLSPEISYSCDRQIDNDPALLDTAIPPFSYLPVGVRSRVWALVGAAPCQIAVPTPLRLRYYPRNLYPQPNTKPTT